MAESKSKETKAAKPSPEFFVKVNEVLAVGNKVARNSNTATAQLVLLHAISRYAAHNYRSTVKQDSAAAREEFAAQVGKRFAKLFSDNLAQMYAAAESAPVAPAKAAGKTGAG